MIVISIEQTQPNYVSLNLMCYCIKIEINEKNISPRAIIRQAAVQVMAFSGNYNKFCDSKYSFSAKIVICN